MNDRYRVTGYSSGPPQLWCIVDSTQFAGERERHANWPVQVWEHPAVGWIWPSIDRAQIQRIADTLNERDESQCSKQA